MKLTKTERDGLAELSVILHERFGATEVLLYGSAARGQMDVDSDIDLLVVLPELNWDMEKEIIGLCFDMELEYGRVFSAVCFSENDLQETPLKESPLLKHARQQGQSL
ncbi:MAG: nucleotidyltransferase domain-containing protein [Phycisphaerae bacterium]|nr:nucleotidyltransferase domain-containing protein [Phycisphaerae bacterium]